MKPSKKLLISATILIVLLLVVILSSWLVPSDPYHQDLSLSLQPPSLSHLLGTDRYGRDLFSRVLLGGRMTILASLSVVFMISVFGTMIGMIAGYCGGKIETLFMRMTDIFLAFPQLVFAMAIASVIQGGIVSAVLALAFVSWPKYARIVRGEVIRLKKEPFIEASYMMGCSSRQIIIHHLLKHVLGIVIVMMVQDIATMILEIAGLSFLGLGVTPPTPEWGSMIGEARSLLQIAPWTLFAPGIAIVITVVTFHVFGDCLCDILDPYQRGEYS